MSGTAICRLETLGNFQLGNNINQHVKMWCFQIWYASTILLNVQSIICKVCNR